MLTRLQKEIYTRRIPRHLVIERSPAEQQRRKRIKAVLHTVLLLLSVFALLFFADRVAADQPRVPAASEVMSLNEVGSGSLLFRSSTVGQYLPATTQTSTAEIKVSGMVARVLLRQTFVNQSDQWQQGIYAFPLPDNAAVNEMRIRIGDRLIEGQIHERKKARKIFEKAKASGKKASLVEQQRPNLFTNSVANIGPGETIEVEIAYFQAVKYDSGVFSLRFPMTITPRYMPGLVLPELASSNSDTPLTVGGAHGWASNTDQVPDASLISPPQMPDLHGVDTGNRIQITGQVNAGMPMHAIDSAYHPIALTRSDQLYSFSLASGEVAMNQDFVLSWRPRLGDAPSAAVFTETLDGDTYAMLLLMPPQTQSVNSAKSLAKEQIFIIDTSGSMGGQSIVQAKASLTLALAQLDPQDRFNVIEFNDVPRAFSQKAVAASADNIRRAQGMVNRLQANGGTEILAALNMAMLGAPLTTGSDQQANKRIRQIIFITDGAVGNEAEIFKSIQSQLGNDRLFTVAIGSAPNSHFMRKASQFGRGSFTHIGNTAEVQKKMSALLNKLDSPVLTDLKLEWPSQLSVESYPMALPDLYGGEPLVFSSRLKQPLDDGAVLDLKVSGKMVDQTWQRSLIVSASADDQRGVASIWARRKIASLLDDVIVGVSEEDIKPKVLAVALQHQLLSRYTSFVAVEKQRSRPRTEGLATSAVPNARAKGQTPQTYAYPQGSTSARKSLLWGMFLLLMLAVVRYSMKAEQRHVLDA